MGTDLLSAFIRVNLMVFGGLRIQLGMGEVPLKSSQRISIKFVRYVSRRSSLILLVAMILRWGGAVQVGADFS